MSNIAECEWLASEGVYMIALEGFVTGTLERLDEISNNASARTALAAATVLTIAFVTERFSPEAGAYLIENVQQAREEN